MENLLASFETIKVFNLPCFVHSIDLPENINHIEHPGKIRGLLVRHLKDVHLHTGDGVTTAIDIWKSLNKPRDVFFFIDGDHSSKSVSRELTTINYYLPNAYILVHDTLYQTEESAPIKLWKNLC